MILKQRIGRIDRPKKHRTQNIYVYYANSENQLLRQASRLSNLHKKLVGEIANNGEEIIPTISSVDALGASIYGDTMFDDEVLPGYIDFLGSLIKARRMEQGNLQYLCLYPRASISITSNLGKLVKLNKCGD